MKGAKLKKALNWRIFHYLLYSMILSRQSIFLHIFFILDRNKMFNERLITINPGRTSFLQQIRNK